MRTPGISQFGTAREMLLTWDAELHRVRVLVICGSNFVDDRASHLYTEHIKASRLVLGCPPHGRGCLPSVHS